MAIQKSGAPDRHTLYQYRIDRMLGCGGSGTVYRGIDPKTGHVYALKLFKQTFFRNALHKRDFAKSVKHFKKFDHQNVARIYDYLTGEEGDCLVMEYVDGPDLRWYMENRPWDLQERIVIVIQICNGLQYIHDQGFTHHDLKPGNILFTRTGIAKLSDFSLCRARMLPFLDSGFQELITPMYVAPELIRKEKATPQSDIYSLGITLYQLFALKPPFEVDTLQKLYQCHLRVIPFSPHEVNRRCPPALSDIIMRMLDKDPAKRFKDCIELRIALAEIGKSRI